MSDHVDLLAFLWQFYYWHGMSAYSIKRNLYISCCSDLRDCVCFRNFIFSYKLRRFNPLTHSMLDKISSSRHFEILLIFFPESRLWHFMKIVFLGKKKKKKENIINLSSYDLAFRAAKVKALSKIIADILFFFLLFFGENKNWRKKCHTFLWKIIKNKSKCVLQLWLAGLKLYYMGIV